jgi:ABC-type Fe3+-hydroxamate transport system substrate-binding protein
MRSYHDQLGRTVQVPDKINRIVCLVPSITELLYDLGIGDKVVGRTKFCVFEGHDFKKATVVGGTKQVHNDRIIALNPDLIIANKEENTKEIVDSLAEKFPVYVSSIQTIHGALSMIDDLGKIIDVENESQQLIKDINTTQIAFHKEKFPEIKVLYLIWQKPFMSIGKDTFIYHMLQEMACISVVNDFRYPELSEEEIRYSSAEYLLLSDEPFPFGEKHKRELQEIFPQKKIILVDGSLFSWYGSRLLKSYNYMQSLRETILLSQ